MDSRRLVALLALSVVACSSGGGGSPSTTPPSTDYTVLGNPELVTFIGYTGDAMEPFVSRDGKYLTSLMAIFRAATRFRGLRISRLPSSPAAASSATRTAAPCWLR